MRRASFADMNCSVAQTLEVVGEWWSLLIVRDALFGITRFDDFASRLGIARNVLTQRLEHLVEQGIFEKIAYSEHPARYDYLLTVKGRELGYVVTVMRQWGDRWAAPDGPPIQLRHHSCGRIATLMPTCSECGEVVRPGDAEPILGPGARTPDLLPQAR